MGLTPRIQGLDPQRTETGPPEYKATGTGTPEEDHRPRETWDFVGFKTLRDLGLRGI